MASIFTGDIDLEYSISSRQVRRLRIGDQVLYDVDNNVAVEGWRDRVWQLIKDFRLDIDKGQGLYAFVYPFIEEYKDKE